jgi:hypothetical protein
MKARELIRNASYGPDHLKVLFTAFDQAWETIAGDVGTTDPLAVEAARLKLADIILKLGREAKDADWLRDAALESMRATTPARSGQGGASSS